MSILPRKSDQYEARRASKTTSEDAQTEATAKTDLRRQQAAKTDKTRFSAEASGSVCRMRFNSGAKRVSVRA